jgi:hypothetical protein
LVSPILVRPVREQLEHDRVIRLLQTKFRRKFEAGMNPGAEQNVSVGSGTAALYPDLVLLSPERGHRLQGVVEVETGESVNHLEALAQWAHFSKARAAFHLYVPAGMVDVARRLCDDHHIYVARSSQSRGTAAGASSAHACAATACHSPRPGTLFGRSGQFGPAQGCSRAQAAAEGGCP